MSLNISRARGKNHELIAYLFRANNRLLQVSAGNTSPPFFTAKLHICADPG
jgi:hypothetical protein